MSEERLNEPLRAVEAALASLAIKPTQLSRDRVIFLAGQASARQSESRRDSPTCTPLACLAGERLGVRGARWFWPLSTAASLLVAVTLGGVLLLGPKSQIIERVVYVPADRQVDSVEKQDPLNLHYVESPEPPRHDYLVLRQLILTRGVEAMPMPVADEPASPEFKTISPRDAYNGSMDLDHSG